MISNLTFIGQVSTFLAANSVGVEGTSLFISKMPPTPVNSVGLYLSGGSETPSKTADRIQFQVVIRDSSYSGGLTRAETVYNLLRNAFNVLTLNGRIEAEGQPGVFFHDDNDLFNFSLNFTTFFPKQ